MMDSSKDFEDPFDYRPLLRKKKVKQLTSLKCTSTQPKRATKSSAKKSQKSPAKKSLKSPSKKYQKSPAKIAQKSPAKKSPTGKNHSQIRSPSKQLSLDSFWNKNTELVTNNESDHYCPMCQVPFNILGDSSRQDHAELCVMLSDCASECKEGLQCQSKYASHFTQFKHILLAHHRAIGAFTRSTEILDTSSIPEFDSNRGKFPPLEREIIAPTPVHNSTPIPRTLSPIKKVGNSVNICVTSEDESPPVERSKATADRLSGNSMAVQRSTAASEKSVAGGRKLSSSHVDQFLQGLNSHKDAQENENSPEILRGHEETPRRRGSVSGHSQEAGPSKQQQPNPTRKPGNIQLQSQPISSSSPGTGSEQDEEHEQGTSKEDRPGDGHHEGDGNKEKDADSDDQGRGSQNYKKSDRDKMRSPIQLKCKRGSEEFEMSLQVEKDTRKVNVKIPMSREPVEVTTRYRDSPSSGGSSSPSKQSKITSFIGINNTQRTAAKNKENRLLSSDSDIESSPGEYVYAKKAKFDSAISLWKQIFKKPDAPPLGKTPTGRPQKGFFGQASDDRHTLKRKVPYYKKIRGTSFAVDAFNYGEIPGVIKYFLSHYHYDHFQGITRHWKKPIVCSSLTKRFLVQHQKVDPSLITTIDPNDERIVDQTQVSCVEANHCPGAVMFIFRLTTGDTILHVGDFRADHTMEENKFFWNNRIFDLVYLDTTYCDPRYDFPSQDRVIKFSQDKALEMAEKHKNLVILVGGYTIGKERIFKGIAEALDCKVWANTKRRGTWKLLEDEVINKRSTEQRSKAQVHVIDQRKLCWNGLKEEEKELKTHFSHILGIKPTGWTHEGKVELEKIKVKTHGNISFLEVPYSEHSSFSELKRFIQFLRIKNTKQIIPTVNLGKWKEMNINFDEWIQEAAAKGPDSQ